MNKITFSAHCAAAIMSLLKMQRDAVGLSVFSDKLEENTPSRSSTLHQKLLYMKLEDAMNSGGVEVKRKTSAAESLHQVADSIHKRSLVIIFSDMMDNSNDARNDIFNALQHLKYNKHEVILFHVVDKKLEMNFNFENRPYQFIDIETGEVVKVHSNQVKELYLEKMNKFNHDLKLKCAQYKIDFIEADIHEGYKQVLMPYLIKRQKMG